MRVILDWMYLIGLRGRIAWSVKILTPGATAAVAPRRELQLENSGHIEGSIPKNPSRMAERLLYGSTITLPTIPRVSCRAQI